MNRENPIKQKKRKLKPIIIIIILICIGFGYYAWRQQQQSIAGLRALKNGGVQVAFSILSRPLIAVDKNQSRLYLIHGHNSQQPERIQFDNIVKIIFHETRTPNKDNTDPKGPDKLFIELDNGSKYEIHDLPGFEDGAQRAYNIFKEHNVLLDKAFFIHRND